MSVDNSPQEQSSSKKWITIALILLLLASWGYIIYDKNATGEIITQKDGQITTVTSEKDSLQTLFTAETSRYDSLKTIDLDKDNQISSKDKELADKEEQIKKLLAKGNLDAHQLAELKRKIKSFEGQIDGYEKQIAYLKAQNDTLTREKTIVIVQRDSIQQTFDSTKKSDDNIIDVGSTLHASNFSVEGIDVKNSGKEKQTTKAKKVNKLHVAFDLDENRIVASGVKQLYICITAPNGKPLSVESQGSGTFTPRDSAEKVFTQKVEVNYVQGQRQTVTTDWKGTSFEVGAYKLEIYENGFKIGGGTVALRKGGLF
jgi:myosin heavy subunit